MKRHNVTVLLVGTDGEQTVDSATTQKQLQGKELPDFLESDPHAYDPAKFLSELMGIHEEMSYSILDASHRTEGE